MAALNPGFQCNWLQYDPQYDEHQQAAFLLHMQSPLPLPFQQEVLQQDLVHR